MTFFFTNDQDEAKPTPPQAIAAERLLVACAEEAANLARRLGALDQQVAELLHHLDLPSGLLQKVDLACQEAAGLAALLDIVASAPSPQHLVDPSILSQAMALSAQRGRILSQS